MRRYRMRLFYTPPGSETRRGFWTEGEGTSPKSASQKVLRRLRKAFPGWTIKYTGIYKWIKEETE